MRAFAAVLLILLATASAAEAAPTTGYTRPAEYGIHRVSDLKIETSDGITLAADVYYPTDPKTGEHAKGNFPVVLAQTPVRQAVGHDHPGVPPIRRRRLLPLPGRARLHQRDRRRARHGLLRGRVRPVQQARREGRCRARGLGGEAARLERQGRRGRLLLRRAHADAHRGQGRPPVSAEGDRAVGGGLRPVPRPRLRRRDPERRLRPRLGGPAFDDGPRSRRTAGDRTAPRASAIWTSTSTPRSSSAACAHSTARSGRSARRRGC